MENLLDLVKGQLTPDFVSKASGLVGESPAGTTAALGAIAPALLSALANKGSTPAGAGEVLATLSDNKVDDNVMGNMTGMLSGGGSTDGLLKIGGALLPMLLGGKSDGVMQLIASLTGIKAGSAGTLMALAAPLIGSLLSKQVKTNGLDAAGLAGMLTSQKGALYAAAPKGLEALLGLGNLASGATSAVTGAMNAAGATAKTATSAASNAASNAASTAASTAAAGGSSVMKWLLPLLAVLVLGFLAWRLLGAGSASADAAKAAVCTNVNGMTAMFTTGAPKITADTKVADVKTWVATVKTGVATLATAAKAASVDVSALTGAVDAADKAVNAATGDTLGAASDAVNTAINGLTTAQNTVKTALSCK